MKLKQCTCGSTRLQEAKFGGEVFAIQALEKWTWLRTSGIRPIPYICLDCGKVHFYIPQEHLQEFGRV